MKKCLMRSGFISRFAVMLAVTVSFCVLPAFAATTRVSTGSINGGSASFSYTLDYETGDNVGSSGTAKVTSNTPNSITYTTTNSTSSGRKKADTGTGTLTITNNTGVKKRVSFEVSAEYTVYRGELSVKVAGVECSTQCSGMLLDINQSIVITAKAIPALTGSIRWTTTTTVKNFVIADYVPTQITTPAVQGASYQVGDTEITTEDMVRDYNEGDTLTLHCTPDDGHSLNGWMIGGTYVPGGEDQTYTVTGNNVTIYPVVMKEGHVSGIFQVNGVLYDTWETAMVAAGGSGTVILVKDHTLPTDKSETGIPISGGTYVKTDDNGQLVYTVPSGVTFLVPYSEDYSTNTNGWDRNGGTKCTGAYVTLTVPASTTIQVKSGGVLIVNAQVSGNSGKAEGVVFGTYGKMIISGTLRVDGTLYARGYLVDSDHVQHTDSSGTGLVQVSSGGMVYMPLQILDYRGGSATNGTKDVLFPLTVYKFQSIMLRAEYQSGSSLYGQYFISLGGTAFDTVSAIPGQTGTFSDNAKLFGSDDQSFVEITSGSVYTDYDYNKDQLIISFGKSSGSSTTCKVNMNDLSVYIDLVVYKMDVTTKGKVIPVGNGFVFKILDGCELTCNNEIKMLPGSYVEVEKGGVLNIPNSLFLYAAGNYESSWSFGELGRHLNVAGLVKNPGGLDAPEEDAVLKVGGKLNVTGSIVESTKHSGSILGMDGGTLISSDFATEGTTYELSNADYENKDTNTEWGSVAGLLAGLSANASDYRDFSIPGAGTYYAKDLMDDPNNAVWYQHIVTFMNGNKNQEIGKGYLVNTGTLTRDLGKFYHPIVAVTAGAAATALSGDYKTLTVSEVTQDSTITITGLIAQIMNNGVVVKEYTSLATAAAAWQSGQYVQMLSDSDDIVSFQNGTVLDLNGYIVKNVTVENVTVDGKTVSGTLYGMDSTSDGYQGAKGSITITGTVAPAAVTEFKNKNTTEKTEEGKSYIVSLHRYLAVQGEGNTWSFHRFNISVGEKYYMEIISDKTAKIGVSGYFRGDSAVRGKLSKMGFKFDEADAVMVAAGNISDPCTFYYTSDAKLFTKAELTPAVRAVLKFTTAQDNCYSIDRKIDFIALLNSYYKSCDDTAAKAILQSYATAVGITLS